MDPLSVLSAAMTVKDLLGNLGGGTQLNENYSVKPGRPLMLGRGARIKRRIPATVERGEVIRDPQGNASKVGGGTHESGNDTDIMAEPGTEVFSADVKIGDKSMADFETDRQENAAKRLRRLKKALKLADSGDVMKLNTARRTIMDIVEDANEDRMEREKHLDMQDSLDAGEQEMGYGGRVCKKMKNGGRVKYAGGTGPEGIEDPVRKNILKQLNENKQFSGEAADLYAEKYGFVKAPSGEYVEIGSQPLTPEVPAATPNIFSEPASTVIPSKSTPKPGDLYEQGVQVQSYAGLPLTLANMLGDKPVPNVYEGYGDQVLGENTKAMSVAGITRDNTLGDIETGLNRGLDITRNVSRGANQYVANATGAIGQANQAKQKAQTSFMQTIDQLLNQRIGLIQDKEGKRAEGRRYAFDENEKQRDNNFGNILASIENIGLGMQKTSEHREGKDDFMSQLFKLIGK